MMSGWNRELGPSQKASVSQEFIEKHRRRKTLCVGTESLQSLIARDGSHVARVAASKERLPQ